MPIEFEEFKNDKPIATFGPTGRALDTQTTPIVEKPDSISGVLVRLKIARNEEYAKLILLIIILIAFPVAIFYGLKTYQTFNVEVDTSPVDLNEI